MTKLRKCLKHFIPKSSSNKRFEIYRNAYTSRILEIIGNIKKQKNDIDKVLNDTRLLQKEINNVTGQLDRQFAVTDDLMFQVNGNSIG